ncbi:hypothetical protein [Sphingobacterium thalpophilum]|uniref:hypothetical protein n=1 Tax=Sphingobacterium thalpophilum TaxID=259 RepID=UPI0024A678C6|nr:hypothetical protein [Sphingobacterium thalpophilum]
MKSGNLNIGISYMPLSAVTSVAYLNGSAKQNYNADRQNYEPDRRLDPLVIKVDCSVVDVHGLINGSVNAHITDIKWYYNEVEINKTTQGFVINGNQLLISVNVPDMNPATVRFSAKYLHAPSNRIALFQAVVVLSTTATASTPITLLSEYPTGADFVVTKDRDFSALSVKLMQGAKELPAWCYWSKGGVAIGNTNGYSGADTGLLFVPENDIKPEGTLIACEVFNANGAYLKAKEDWVESQADIIAARKAYNDAVADDKRGDYAGRNYVIDSDRITSAKSAFITFPISKRIKGKVSIQIWCEKTTEGGIGIAWGNAQGWSGNYFVITDANNNLKNGLCTYLVNYTDSENYTDICIYVNEQTTIVNIKLEYGDQPSSYVLAPEDVVKSTKISLDAALSARRQEAETAVSVPVKPAVKPSGKSYPASFQLIRKFPRYELDLLCTKDGVPPDTTELLVELGVKTNQGTLINPEDYFSVGWLKQDNGTYKYKGFRNLIKMSDLLGGDLNYDLFEEVKSDLFIGRNSINERTSVGVFNAEALNIDLRKGWMRLIGNKDKTGRLRFVNVIKGNGEWTVSFQSASNLAGVILSVSINDIAVGTLNHISANTYNNFTGTLNVTNHTPDLYNFLEISGFTENTFELNNLKLERGTVATPWTP